MRCLGRQFAQQSQCAAQLRQASCMRDAMMMKTVMIHEGVPKCQMENAFGSIKLARQQQLRKGRNGGGKRMNQEKRRRLR